MTGPIGPVPPTFREQELFANRPVLAGIWQLDGGSESHGHDFVEVAVIGRGSGRHISAHGETPLRQGDLLVLRPGAWHGFVRCDGLEVANCCLSAHALRTRLSFLYDDPALRRLLWTGPVLAGRQGTLITHVRPEAAGEAIGRIRALGTERPTTFALLLGRLLTILGTLVEGLPARVERAESPAQVGVSGSSGGGAGAAHPAVRELAARLEAAPERPWRLEELADLAALDADYLSRLFRQGVGLSPMAYLARVRAERAADLLGRTAEPVARIGALVGWPDPTYFARRFRALTGLSPTRYRARARTRGPAAAPPHPLGEPT